VSTPVKDVTCWHCGQKGHVKYNCPSRDRPAAPNSHQRRETALRGIAAEVARNAMPRMVVARAVAFEEEFNVTPACCALAAVYNGVFTVEEADAVCSVGRSAPAPDAEA
jgi:hypothetical protein